MRLLLTILLGLSLTGAARAGAEAPAKCRQDATPAAGGPIRAELGGWLDDESVVLNLYSAEWEKKGPDGIREVACAGRARDCRAGESGQARR